MSLAADLRKTAADLGYTLVGVVDVAAEQAKELGARARARQVEVAERDYVAEARALSGRLQQAPTQAVVRGLEVASKAQETVDGLTRRGRRLVGRVQRQEATQDLEEQVTVTLDRGRATARAARQGAEETARTARQGAEETAQTASEQAKGVRRTRSETARTRTQSARSGTQRTTAAAEGRARGTKDAAQGAAGSARSTARATGRAVKDAADKAGS